VLAEERLDETSPVHHGGPPQPPRRPYWPAALFVIGLLVALLGAAVVLNDRFRPRPTIEPAATTVAVTTPPAAPSTPPTARPTVVPTATVAPAAVPTPTTAPTAVPTTASSPTAAAAKPTSSAATPAGTPAATAAPSVLTPLQKEIIEGYLLYWEVRIQAYYDLDTSQLGRVMAGAELAREEQQIHDLKARGRAAKLDIDHSFRITKGTADEAEVYDEYVNRSLFVDATTKVEMPTKETPPVEKVTFQMRKLDGSWKVVDGTRRS
jgi:hypothetical protein